MASNYEVGRFLGKGSFAYVHLARDIRSRRHYAIKIVDVTDCRRKQQHQQHHHPTERATYELNSLLLPQSTTNILDLLQQEIDVQTSVSSHPNIVSLLDSFSYTNELTGSEMKAILLEYCPWGDLQCYFKTVRENKQKHPHHHIISSSSSSRSNDGNDDDTQILWG